jgi:DNA-binding transcriptional regulator YiaG
MKQTANDERTFALALILYRQAMGLNQDDFAELLSTSVHTVKSWERNVRITTRTLPKVLEDLGKTREELLSWYQDTMSFVRKPQEDT